MSHIISTPLGALGAIASKLQDLPNQRPSAQEALGDRQLDEARDLFPICEDLIVSPDLDMAREKVLEYVHISQSVSELCFETCQGGDK